MLEIRQIHAGYGSAKVLFGIDFTMQRGEVVALMGRNGMGRSTLVKCIMGLVRPNSGEITFRGLPLHNMDIHQIARTGLGYVPEGRRVFGNLTVRENLIATARKGRNQKWKLATVYDFFPKLSDRSNQIAGTLSGGEQQMLAIGRALMTNPELLILDEATEGLAPTIRQEIWATLARIKSEGEAILIVDKNVDALRQLADRFCVLEKGKVVVDACEDQLDFDQLEKDYLTV